MLIKGQHQTSASLFNHILLATSRYGEDYLIRIMHFSRQIWFNEVRFLMYYWHVILSESVIKVFYSLHLLTFLVWQDWLLVNHAFTAFWHTPKVHEHVALITFITVQIISDFLQHISSSLLKLVPSYATVCVHTLVYIH